LSLAVALALAVFAVDRVLSFALQKIL